MTGYSQWNRKTKSNSKKLGWEFIRTNPDEEGFNVFNAINKIRRHIKKLAKELAGESSEKFLTDKISRRLLELEFEKMTQKSLKNWNVQRELLNICCSRYKTCKLIV